MSAEAVAAAVNDGSQDSGKHAFDDNLFRKHLAQRLDSGRPVLVSLRVGEDINALIRPELACGLGNVEARAADGRKFVVALYVSRGHEHIG